MNRIMNTMYLLPLQRTASGRLSFSNVRMRTFSLSSYNNANVQEEHENAEEKNITSIGATVKRSASDSCSYVMNRVHLLRRQGSSGRISLTSLPSLNMSTC